MSNHTQHVDGVAIVPAERIVKRIVVIREMKVMFDRDLAELYEVETKALNRAVKRNMSRFPSEFMFQLTKEEYDALRYQFGTLKKGQHSKYLPYVFTEQGVAMLASVLNSNRAIQVSVQIIKTFMKLREMLTHYKDLNEKIEKMETKYDAQFKVVFDAIRQLITPPEEPKRRIGFGVE
jgi:phage regulator Rha-like protein